MKTVPSMKHISNLDVKRAVIALTRPTLRTFECSQFHMYKLRTTQADTNSPTYELSIPFYDEETPKQWIKFRRGLQGVFKGQNVTQ
eukprot:7775100-Ditylum_brightwellii.AAC.1